MTPEKRRYLSPVEKATVIGRQAGRCACGCREPLVVGRIDFDHAVALQFKGTNDLGNFVALVHKHHQKKSNRENTIRAKCDRIRDKRSGKWLSAQDRELARRMGRTKQI